MALTLCEMWTCRVPVPGYRPRGKAMRQQISSAIGVVVQVARLTDGKRKVVSVQEVTGMEGEIITMQEIFAFKQTGTDANGMVQGYFSATGVRPRFGERLRTFGLSIPDDIFTPTTERR